MLWRRWDKGHARCLLVDRIVISHNGQSGQVLPSIGTVRLQVCIHCHSTDTITPLRKVQTHPGSTRNVLFIVVARPPDRMTSMVPFSWPTHTSTPPGTP